MVGAGHEGQKERLLRSRTASKPPLSLSWLALPPVAEPAFYLPMYTGEGE